MAEKELDIDKIIEKLLEVRGGKPVFFFLINFNFFSMYHCAILSYTINNLIFIIFQIN